MGDRLTPQQRHTNMAAIKGKDTKPELLVRKYLWSHGFRYRLNHPRLPGKPDIVLRRFRTCIFVNGCFWHGHKLFLQFYNYPTEVSSSSNQLPDTFYESISNSACCKIPHTNRKFWVDKILRNHSRDERVQRQLAEMGWHCITIWECELSTHMYSDTQTIRERTLQSLAHTLNTIYLRDHQLPRPHHYTIPDEEQYPSIAAEDSPFLSDESADNEK